MQTASFAVSLVYGTVYVGELYSGIAAAIVNFLYSLIPTAYLCSVMLFISVLCKNKAYGIGGSLVAAIAFMLISSLLLEELFESNPAPEEIPSLVTGLRFLPDGALDLIAYRDTAYEIAGAGAVMFPWENLLLCLVFLAAGAFIFERSDLK